MRNEVIFDDYQIPTQTYIFSKAGTSHTATSQQTTEYQQADRAIQTNINNSGKQSFQVQVDYRSFNQEGDEPQYVELDEEGNKRLLKFLKKLEPTIIREIEESLAHQAYQNYDPSSESHKQDTKVLYTLENLVKEAPGLTISDLAWNATGMVVAASLSSHEHTGSCGHKGLICTWSIFKRDFKPTCPQIIQTNGCVNCLAFHPAKPSLLACGTYSGEILLYDLSREDQNLIAKSTVDDYYHREIISRLIWWEYRIPGSSDVIYNILSLATDGKILLWDMRYTQKHKKQLLQNPIKGFSLLRRRDGLELPVGGLSMEMSKQNKNLFIVGSEGGSVLRASLSNILLDKRSKTLLDMQTTVKFPGSVYPFMLNLVPERLPEIKSHVEKYCTQNKINEVSMQVLFKSRPEQKKIYPNSINFAYEPILSPVMSISCNNYNLFIVNGCEGSSKLYKQGQRASLQSIDGGWDVRWISDSKLGGFFDQQWMAFDWLTGDIINKVSAPKGTKWSIKQQMAILACEDNKVKVVRLSNSLLEVIPNQRQLIEKKIESLLYK